MINNTYAIIKSGGKQIKAESGQAIWIEKIDTEVDKTVTFKEVIALSNNGEISLGTPLLEEVAVKAVVQKHGKGPKLVIFRTKAKSNWSRKQGHRQPYTRLLVEEIILNGKVISEIDATKAKVETKKPVAKPATKKPVEAKKVVAKKPAAKPVEAKKPVEAEKPVETKKVVAKTPAAKPVVKKDAKAESTKELLEISSKMQALKEKAAVLDAHDLKLIDIKGIGVKTLEYMHENNIFTIGDLVNLNKNLSKGLIAGLPGLKSEAISIKNVKFINFLEQAHIFIEEQNAEDNKNKKA